MSLELNPKIEIRSSPIEGQGLFALHAFKSGERIQLVHGDAPEVLMSDKEFQAYIATVDSWDAVYMGNGTHKVSMVPRAENPSNYGNHSCNPNTALDGNQRIVVRHIEPGDEITVDYSLHSPKNWSMVCHCGSPKCLGVVRGVL